MNLCRIAAVLMFVLAAGACSSSPSAPATPASNAAAEPAAPVAAATPAPPPAPEPAPAPAPKRVTAPAGTVLNVILVDALSSDKSQPGDTFNATLAAPLVVKGETLLEKGARVQGRVVDAEESGRVKGRASMRLVLTGVTRGEKVIPIVTKQFVVEAESSKKRDAGIIAGAAGVGAAIGAIAGGGKGAAIGAGVGGGAGTGTVLATKGKEVKFEPESKLRFTLEKPVELVPTAKKTT